MTARTRGAFWMPIVQAFTESKSCGKLLPIGWFAQEAVGDRRYKVQLGARVRQEGLADLVMVTCPTPTVFMLLL